MNISPNRIIIYCRKSSDNENLSVLAQEITINNFLKSNNINPDIVSLKFTTIGSAYTDDKTYTKLMQVANKKNYYLCVSDITRLSRNLTYFNKLLLPMFLKNNTKICIASTGKILDLKNETDLTFLRQGITNSENESKLKSSTAIENYNRHLMLAREKNHKLQLDKIYDTKNGKIINLPVGYYRGPSHRKRKIPKNHMLSNNKMNLIKMTNIKNIKHKNKNNIYNHNTNINNSESENEMDEDEDEDEINYKLCEPNRKTQLITGNCNNYNNSNINKLTQSFNNIGNMFNNNNNNNVINDNTQLKETEIKILNVTNELNNNVNLDTDNESLYSDEELELFNNNNSDVNNNNVNNNNVNNNNINNNNVNNNNVNNNNVNNNNVNNNNVNNNNVDNINNNNNKPKTQTIRKKVVILRKKSNQTNDLKKISDNLSKIIKCLNMK